MSTSERTPLTDTSTDRNFYGHDTYHFYTRRRRQRQLQSCIFITIITIFVMALVVSVSYSIRHSDDPDSDVTNVSASQPSTNNLKLSISDFQKPSLPSIDSRQTSPTSTGTELTSDELEQGLAAAAEAIKQREIANDLGTPLGDSQSPSSRLQLAISTSARADELALAAVGEIAATRKVETLRRLSNESTTSFGSFFDGNWIPGSCSPFISTGCRASKYRTVDGSCNHPLGFGSAMKPFKRWLPADYSDGIESPRKASLGEDLPSAREISVKVHAPSPSSNPSFTVMLAVFGQFLDHDITATALSKGKNGTSLKCCPPSTGHPECYPVLLGHEDPVFLKSGKTCMEFIRSAPSMQCKIGPREQLNQVTAFIDGSVIYGSDQETADQLREHEGGFLRMQRTADNRTLLPASSNLDDGCNRELERSRGRYCFLAGDNRANENLHLTTMHVLWARQHNLVASKLAEVNPHWDDEQLYQEARRVVSAQLQHITYEEFLPIIVGEREMILKDLRPQKSGYREPGAGFDESFDPRIANSFASAAFRFAHTLLPGLMKMTDLQKGTSSYLELHRMLFNPYSLYSAGGFEASVISATTNLVQRTSTHVTSQLTKHLFEDPLSNVTIPCGLDLVSLNIQRGRDHGVPGYVRWREFCGLSQARTFEDLRNDLDGEVLDEIARVYESVEDVDLYTGALAEIPKSGAIVGPTFTCLISRQFLDLQRGDRFWYEVGGEPHSFSEGQLKELRKSSLSKLICDCSDGITQIQSRVMRSVAPENPLISCEDLPAMSFVAWREDVPKETAVSPDDPNFWLDFKKDINDTVKNFVDSINSKKPLPGDPEWINFRKYVNDSLADLKKDFVKFHPKVTEKGGSQGLKESFDDVNAGLNKSQIVDDWIDFKQRINSSINDFFSSVNFSAFDDLKADLKDYFADLKAEIKSLKNSTIWKVKTDKKNKTKSGTLADLRAQIDPKVSDLRKKSKPETRSLEAIFDKTRDDLVNGRSAAFLKSVPTNWISYLDNVNKTINSVLQKIEKIGPAEDREEYETNVEEFLDEMQGIVEKKRSEFEATTLRNSGNNLNVFGCIFIVFYVILS